MQSILAWGVDVVRFVQGAASPALTVLMKGLSALGSEWFYLAILPVIYWCVDRRRGARLGLVFFGSSFLNVWLKDLFAQPRPYDLDPAVGLSRETSYGLPSGHSQGSVVFWGMTAPVIKRPWGLIIALLLPLLIGLSRVYLGVHFPTDVFAGWGLGALIVAAVYFFGERLERLLSRLDLRLKVALVAAASFGMNALHMKDTSISGAFFGAGLGFAFVGRLAPFVATGGLGKRALRYLLGIAGAAAIYLGLKALFPGPGSELYGLFRFVRYGLLGAWVALGAPWLFIRLGLAEREPAAA